MLFASLLLLWAAASLIQPPTVAVDLIATAMSCVLILHFCNDDRGAIVPMLAWPVRAPGGWRTTVFVAIVLFPLIGGYLWFAGQLGFPIPTSQERQPHMPMSLIVILSCVVAPSIEELCFRGYMLGKLTRALGVRDALIIQAALFSVLHLAPVSFVSHFIIGLALGYLARTTKSLYPPIAVHAAWNSLVILYDF